MKAQVRIANRTDNEALLALARRTPMPGMIALRIDRDPDFFRLVDLRGGGFVFVAEVESRLVGCLSLTSCDVYAAGDIRRLWYVGDLKVQPEHRGSGIAVRLGRAASAALREAGADLLCCLVSAGNRRALSFLDGQFDFPRFEPLGRFDVRQYMALRYPSSRDYSIEEAADTDSAAIASLYHGHVLRYELAPVIQEARWLRAIESADLDTRVIVARRGKVICGAAVLLDTARYKQHVVVGLPASLRLLTAPLRPFGPLSPAFRIPRTGEIAHMVYVRHLCVADGHEQAASAILRHACRHAHASGYPFAVLGVHEQDPLGEQLRRIPRFTMGSEAYLSSPSGNVDLVEQVRSGIAVADYSLA